MHDFEKLKILTVYQKCFTVYTNKNRSSPLEDIYLKYENYTTKDDLKERVNHALKLITSFESKQINKERQILTKELIKLKNKIHTRTTLDRAINRIVKITNDLYNIQNKHNKLQHDQTYFGLRDIEHLFSNIISYKPILVRSSFRSGYEEYEISGNVKKVLSVK